jgi:hypothetical protein
MLSKPSTLKTEYRRSKKVEELIRLMSIEDLQAMKVKYPTNESIQKLLDVVIGQKTTEVNEAKERLDFEAKVAKLKLPAPPRGIVNVYLRWAEVEVPTGEPVEVEVVKVQAVQDADGHITTPAIMEKVMRQAKTKVFQWVPELNKPNQATTTTGATTSAKQATKRAITVSKRNVNILEPVGHFTNASKACEHLKLTIGGDSAKRVLVRNGYIIDDYDGTDTIA